MYACNVRKAASRARLLAVATACLAGLALPAAGDDAAPLLTEEDYLAAVPVVVTASRLSQPLSEAPSAVTVIDRQMIQASGARNLSEIFRLVPGFLVSFENGHRHVVGYHGLTDEFSRRLQVLIDGRSVYLPSFGGVSWSDLPLALEDIERIEVIRGPNAVSYGANSFLAIISITTRHSAADHGGTVRATAGSNAIRDGMMRTAGGSGDLHYRLTTGYQQDNGYGQRNDSRRISFLNGRIDWVASQDNDVEYQFGYNQGPRGRGYPGDETNYPHDQEITSRFQQIRWRQRLANGGEWSLQLYHNHHESDEQYQSLPIAIPIPPFVTQIQVNYDLRSERNDIEFQHIQPWGPVRIAWGLGARNDRVWWPGFLGSSEPFDLQQYRWFTNLEWRLSERWLVNSGVMLEHNELTGNDVSPRLAVNYLFRPGHTLRFGVSGATRQPLLIEEQSYARFCADPGCTLFDQTFYSRGNLEPERILASELGYFGRLTSVLTLDARLFRDFVTQLISMVDATYADSLPDQEAFDFRNGDKAMITGGEFQLQWQPERGTRLILGYANVLIESNDQDARYSESAPRNSLNLLAIQDLGDGWQGSAAYYYQDEMRYVGEHRIPAQRRIDLRLARRVRMAGTRIESAFVVQNLLGKQVAFNDEDSVADRIAYLSLGMHFR